MMGAKERVGIMMKKTCRWLCLVLACFLLTGCGRAAAAPGGEYRVVVASDLHYLSPELTDHGEAFRQVMNAGDGKATEYCGEITDAFLAEVAEARPDGLILTGDLSFNGERKSHEALAEKLAELEEAGVPVLVLPGNHDLFRGTAYAFFGETAEPVPTVTAEEFREIYAPFGFDEAIAEDADSLSYVARLNDTARVLMLDANTLHDYCGFSDKTLSWIESQLAEAKEEGAAVLAACHQNLYQHSMFGAGYVLAENEELRALLEKYRVPLMLSGHMHIQHVMTQGSVTEIASSALTMGACQYGVLEAEKGTLDYHTRPVDVSAWAKEHGIEKEELKRFAAYAMDSMEKRTRAQAESQLAARGYRREEIRELTEFACALNDAYFCGDLTAIPALDPQGNLLRRWTESGTFFGSYFASLEPEIGKNHTVWSSAQN